MKKIFSILAFVLSSIVCFSQGFYCDAKPYKKQLLVDGNSLNSRANGNLANAYAAPLAAYAALTVTPKPPIQYYAVSGKTIAQLISDFPTKIAPYAHAGDVIVMNEATNSLAVLQSPSLVYADLLAYRDLVRALGCKIVVGTMTARTGGYANTETDRLALNALIISNSSEFDAVADVGGLTEFNSVAAASNSTYYNADGLHFATAGYTLYGQTFAAVLNQFFN